MKSAQGRGTLLIIVALIALSQLGCVVNGRRVELTAEQAALHVEPPRKGEERFSLRRSAPEGVLIVFENVANPPRDPDWFKIGVALVARESFGWAVQNSGTFASNSRHGMLISTMAPGGPDNTLVFYGKIVDARVRRVLASFSSGQQMEDTVVNGLFGMIVVPQATLCRLELMDAEGQRIESFDWGDVNRVLAGFLGVPVGLAQQECKLSQENKP
jgi:hypothetical protein